MGVPALASDHLEQGVHCQGNLQDGLPRATFGTCLMGSASKARGVKALVEGAAKTSPAQWEGYAMI